MPESSADVYERVKGRQPDKASKEWLDWCYIWDRCIKNQLTKLKQKIDAGQLDYGDFREIWRATSGERRK